MRPNLIALTLVSFCTIALVSAMPAHAAILMLDFGTASGVYNGNNSPGHADGAISNSFTTWNQISGAADGSVNDSESNSITYDLGRASTSTNTDTGTAVFGSQPTNTSAAAGSGIWGTTLTTDAAVDITSSNRRDPVAIQLGGFAAGSYDAYLVAHHAGNLGVPLQVGFLVSSTDFVSSPGSILFSDMTSVAALTPDGDTSTWGQGTDFYKASFDIEAGDFLYFMVNNPNNDGTGVAHQATISSLQVALIPEPASLALLGLGGLCLLGGRSRRG